MNANYPYNEIQKRAIIRKISAIPQTKFLDIFYSDTPEAAVYQSALEQICKIEYPVSAKFEKPKTPEDLIKKIYSLKNISPANFNLLIPGFEDSGCYVHLNIGDMAEFLRLTNYGSDMQFTAIDTENKFIFDIELNEENGYDILLLDLK